MYGIVGVRDNKLKRNVHYWVSCAKNTPICLHQQQHLYVLSQTASRILIYSHVLAGLYFSLWSKHSKHMIVHGEDKISFSNWDNVVRKIVIFTFLLSENFRWAFIGEEKQSYSFFIMGFPANVHKYTLPFTYNHRRQIFRHKSIGIV